jgi:hypothetical protein
MMLHCIISGYENAFQGKSCGKAMLTEQKIMMIKCGSSASVVIVIPFCQAFPFCAKDAIGFRLKNRLF